MMIDNERQEGYQMATRISDVVKKIGMDIGYLF